MLKKQHNIHKRLTDLQLQQMLILREEELSWDVIATTVNRRWGANYSALILKNIHQRTLTRLIEAIKADNAPEAKSPLAPENVKYKTTESKTKKKRFTLWAVAPGAEVDAKKLAVVECYNRERNAKPVLLPGCAHMKPMQGQPKLFDEKIEPYLKHMHQEFLFNGRAKALNLQIRPQRINPLTSIERIRGKLDLLNADDYNQMIKPRNQSMFIPSPKQTMKIYATGNATPPRMIHATGFLSEPTYRMNETLGHIAAEDHVMGGLVVETDGDIFHVRQLQFNPVDGTIVDFTPEGVMRYYPNGKVKKERIEGLVVGDLHPGHDNPKALAWLEEQIKIGNPKKIFLHDWFDAITVNHHISKKILTKMLSKAGSFQTLHEEIAYARDYFQKYILDHISDDCEVYMVPSNHELFLSSWLNGGLYMKTDVPEDFKLGHQMIVEALDGIDSLRIRLDPNNRMKWPSINDDVFVEGVQCNAHGHQGPKGSRGNPGNLERVYNSVMAGHTHTASILHEYWGVGHMSSPRHGYNSGASDWTTTNGIILKGGHKQLISLVGGKWTI